MLPNHTNNWVVGFQSWSIGKGSISPLPLITFSILYPSLVTATFILPKWNRRPPCRPPSHVSLSPPDSSLSKIPDPPPLPLPVLLFYLLISPPLYLRLVLITPATVSDSEPSLAACLRQAPTNSWLVAPESAWSGAPVPEVFLRPNCAADSTWKLGGLWVVLLEYVTPPDNIGPEIYSCLGSSVSDCIPPPPPSPVPRTTACVPTPSLQMGGGFRVAPMTSTSGSPGTVICPVSPSPHFFSFDD